MTVSSWSRDRIQTFTMKFLRFSCIAGFGWMLDMVIYSTLISSHVRIALANVFSGFIGVTFSYFMSARVVFYYQGGFLATKFALYVLYNSISILLFSLIIETVSLQFGVNPIWMKCFITPVTLSLNFIVLACLLRRDFRYRSG